MVAQVKHRIHASVYPLIQGEGQKVGLAGKDMRHKRTTDLTQLQLTLVEGSEKFHTPTVELSSDPAS